MQPPDLVAKHILAAKGAFGPLRRTVNRLNIDMEAKVSYANTLGVSKLLFNAEVWENLTSGQLQQLHAARITALRSAVNMALTPDSHTLEEFLRVWMLERLCHVSSE